MNESKDPVEYEYQAYLTKDRQDGTEEVHTVYELRKTPWNYRKAGEWAEQQRKKLGYYHVQLFERVTSRKEIPIQRGY